MRPVWQRLSGVPSGPSRVGGADRCSGPRVRPCRLTRRTGLWVRKWKNSNPPWETCATQGGRGMPPEVRAGDMPRAAAHMRVSWRDNAFERVRGKRSVLPRCTASTTISVGIRTLDRLGPNALAASPRSPWPGGACMPTENIGPLGVCRRIDPSPDRQRTVSRSVLRNSSALARIGTLKNRAAA